MDHQELITKEILSGRLFFIGRIAGIELQVAYHMLKGNIIDKLCNLLESNAGIHCSTTASMEQYVSELIKAYKASTMIAEWDKNEPIYKSAGPGQELIAEMTPKCPKISAYALEPYYYAISWMSALRGKRLLIVHPFVATFKAQIERNAKPFKDKEWFQDCTFTLISPPFTLAGNHKNIDWQVHYDECIKSISKEVSAHPIDIALVGAGGYGMLLSHHIYSVHAISTIYVGGALQLFFGVIGKRWFNNSKIMELMNDDWIQPVMKDRPQNYRSIENGCYW
jgi:hypothetical protein